MKKQITDAIYGFIVGDALGVPVEFQSREQLKKNPVIDMRSYGTYNQPKGTWSDDTSLTLALMDTIIHGYSLEKLALNMISYLSGNFTPYHEMFDIGIGTRIAIQKMKHAKHPELCGGFEPEDNGNGSLMRILPMAFFTLNKKEEEMISLIQNCSSCTHGHMRSIFACVFYSVFIQSLFMGKGKMESYQDAIDFMYRHEDIFKEEMKTYSSVLDLSLLQRKEEEIHSSGYVLDTLEAVIYSFIKYNNYKECVLFSINLGKDTDTIGAITGSLAGLYYGKEAIPEDWIDSLARKDYLDEIIQNFVHVIK